MQYTYSRWDEYVNELEGLRTTASGTMAPDYAGAALRHFVDRYRQAGYRDWGAKVERAFHLWTVLAESPVRLFTGESHGYSQSDWHIWFALVDTAVMERDGYTGTPEDVAKTEADEYAAYAYGDVFGVIATSEDGDEESLWQVVDRDGKYVREVADELVDELHGRWSRDQGAKREQASLVGAGFVGVI